MTLILEMPLLEMFELLLEIVDCTDTSDEWDTGVECTTVSRISKQAHILLKKCA